MKALLKVSLLALGIVAAALPSMAAATTPEAATPAPRAHLRRGARLMRRAAIRRHVIQKLGLTDAQKAQLKAARASTVAAVKAIRADTTLTPEQKKAKVRETLQSARTQMRSALTPDQQAKLDQLRARIRKGHGA